MGPTLRRGEDTGSNDLAKSSLYILKTYAYIESVSIYMLRPKHNYLAHMNIMKAIPCS